MGGYPAPLAIGPLYSSLSYERASLLKGSTESLQISSIIRMHQCPPIDSLDLVMTHPYELKAGTINEGKLPLRVGHPDHVG